jgi:molecular chaperone DnaJ
VGDIFGDFFGEMFNMGGGRRNGRGQRGRDIRYDLRWSSKRRFSASRQRSSSAVLRSAPTAAEAGRPAGRGPETCKQCAGRGQVRYQQGFFSIARTCPICNGAGQVITDPCLQCNGAGLTDRRHTISVSVPAGVEDGTRIRYQGEGDAGRSGGPKGDLYVVLSVKPHEFFERDGNDLHCVIFVSFPQVALGDEIHVPTLEGDTCCGS